MNSHKYDDEEAVDMILEFEVESDGERTDEEDEDEIEGVNYTGETTDAEDDDDADDGENGIGETYQYVFFNFNNSCQVTMKNNNCKYQHTFMDIQPHNTICECSFLSCSEIGT